MESRRTRRFVELFDQLPASVQKQAREAYRLWRADPGYPGLEFKKIHHRSRSIYSIRIGIGWRALGIVEDNRISWFWIGSHADYDRMLKRR